jgi:subtilisin family serine protease
MLPCQLRAFVTSALTAVVLVALPSGGPPAASAAETATAHVAGSVTTPSKRKSRPARPVAEAISPKDPLWGNSWSLKKVGAPAAWRVTTGVAQTVVAVLDTGIDLNHPDLAGAFVDGWDAVNEDADPTDDHGHGTLVAGVIAARSNNGIGGVGACWRCSLMPVKVIGANGSGSAADIAEGIVWAADHGASVINMSFVMTGPDAGVANALEYARSKGSLVVAAAGNAGSSEATFPAGQPGVVSVTGTDPADARYDWASYGSWVKLAAPGCSQSTQAGGGYADFCGSSSAAAFVSGIAALARSAATTASADVVATALLTNAVQVGDFVAGGRVDAAAALAAPALSCCGRPAPADSRPGRPEPRPDRL